MRRGTNEQGLRYFHYSKLSVGVRWNFGLSGTKEVSVSLVELLRGGIVTGNLGGGVQGSSGNPNPISYQGTCDRIRNSTSQEIKNNIERNFF